MMNPLSNPSYLLSPLVVAFISFILAVIVWRQSRRRLSSRLFCGFLVSLGIWSLLLFPMRSSPDIQHALPWDKAVAVAGYVTYLLYYHFTLTYTNTRGQKGFRIASYLLLVVFVVLAPTHLMVEGIRLEYYGYAPVLGPLAFLLSASVVFLLGVGAYNLVRRYNATYSYEERNRILYLLIAILFPLAGGLLDAFSNLPPATIWSNLAFCVICSIAILKYHLLDIRIIVRKSLVYLLISILVAIPYVGLLYFLYFLFEPPMQPWWVHTLIILFLAVLLRPLYSRAQQLVDRLFYRDRYDYLRALERFSREAQSVTNLEKLGLTMVKLVTRALRSSSACLLLPSEGEGGLTVLSCVGLDNPPSGIILRKHSLLVRWLELQGHILSSRELKVIPNLQGIARVERENIEKLQAELFIPMKTREGILSGILVLGEKLGQQAYSGEDIQLLATLANQMAMALENARLYELEKTVREKLEKQDEQKTEFLHSVGHELKTPLTAIISSSELLGEELSVDHNLRKRLIKNIRQSAGSMDRRVSELLDLAEIQIGELRIEPEPSEVAPIITEVASQLHILFESKKQTLTIEIPGSLPKVNVDRGKLEQVLFNLLSNANKFSPIGSEIILRAREADRKIIVEVEDSAPVVIGEEKRRIFDPYYRSDDPEKREQFSGLGLGLSISKKLVELHQGEIWVENKSAKGNIFGFSLPALEQRTKGTG